MEIDELREKIREEKNLKCCKEDCERTAIDVHHLDGNHSNNTPENIVPICKLHHNEIHGITPQIDMLGALVRNFWRIQKNRLQIENQIRAYKAIEYPTDLLEKPYDAVKNIENDIGNQIKKEVKSHIMWEEAKEVKGLGHILFAALVSELRDPKMFNNPSKMIKLFGYHTVNGKAVKRSRGNKLGFSIKRRVIVWKIGDSFNKVRNRGNVGKLLKEYHEFEKQLNREYPKGYLAKNYNGYKNADTHLTKGHILNRAKRKTVKIFLICFWDKWMRLLGETPTKPFAFDKLNHKNLITWDDLKG